MQTKNSNIEEITAKIKDILEKYNVTKAGIFGSYARGEQRKNSDVDILIEIDDSIDLIEFIRLKNLIEKAIKKKVDLVEYSLIRKELRETILNEEVPILQ